MEIAEELEATDGDESQAMDSVEVVAETPPENQKATMCPASETDLGDGSPSKLPNGLNSVASSFPSNSEGGPQWERRQQGGNAGQGRPNASVPPRGNDGKNKETVPGADSRYALLENAKENDGPEPQVEADTSGNPTRDARSKGLEGRPKRMNVIVNEKQIQNEACLPRAESPSGTEVSQGRRLTGSSSRRGPYRGINRG
nr:hypothetical protein Itr_chr14CG09710 [Ipomoea trifida]